MVTEKITLRPLRTEDGTQFLNWYNDLTIRNDIGGIFPFTEQTFREICNRGDMDSPPNIWFAIEVYGCLSGIAGLHDIKYIQRNAEISMLIGDKENRGKGIGSNALQKLTDYAFSYMGLHRLYAKVYEHNIASMKVLEKNGFVREGVLKDASWWNGSFRDVYVYGKINDNCISCRSTSGYI